MAAISNAPVADRLLVGRMAEGEDIALGELYDRYGKTLYALALAIVREPADAEDVVVDAFGQAWRQASTFDPGRGSVGAWLATIARSRALDVVRARGRRARAHERAASLSEDGIATPIAGLGPDPGRGAERSEARRLVAALARTPADSVCGYARRAFVLRDAAGRVLGAERCTAQEAEEITWIRLEARVATPAGLRVLNAFLFESFGDQVNVVQANVAGRSRTMLFTRGDEPKPVGE